MSSIPKTNAEELARIRKGRVLLPHEQDTYIKLLARGLTSDKILRKMKISRATLDATREAPGFTTRLEAVYEHRKLEIECKAFMLATGETKIVETTYVPKLNRHGDQVNDLVTGEPIMLIKSRTVKEIPMKWDAIKFLLQAYMPDKYAAQNLHLENRMETVETLKSIITSKKKELENRFLLDGSVLDGTSLVLQTTRTTSATESCK